MVRPSARLKKAGFTLVEVLVAVAIVAMAASALLFAMMRQIDGTVHLRDKAAAQWVASNQLALMRLANRASNALPSEPSSGQVAMAEREWLWRAVPVKVEAEGFIQVDMEVRAADRAEGSPVVVLSGLLDQFH